MIRTENGEGLLHQLLTDSRPYERVKQLAQIVLFNVEAVDKRMAQMRQEGGGAGAGLVYHQEGEGEGGAEGAEEMETDEEEGDQE